MSLFRRESDPVPLSVSSVLGQQIGHHHVRPGTQDTSFKTCSRISLTQTLVNVQQNLPWMMSVYSPEFSILIEHVDADDRFVLT